MSNNPNLSAGSLAWIAVTVLALSLALCPAGLAGEEVQVEKPFHQEIDAAGISDLTVEIVNGSITASGIEGERVVIDATLAVSGKERAVCEELLEKIEIEIEKEKGGISIEPKLPNKKDYTCKVSFDLQLPGRMNLDAETVNGGISASGLAGNCDLETVNGGVSCRGLSGAVDAETVNGGVEVEKVSGDLDVETVNGGMSVRCGAPASANIDLETVNGAIELQLILPIDAVLSAEATNGRLAFNGIPEEALVRGMNTLQATLGSGKGNYSLSTVNGSVSVTVTGAE